MAPLDPLQNIFESGRNLAPAAVGSQVLLMSLLSVATVLVFNILRPNNKVIYEPKVKYHEGDKPPPPISDSFFGWLPPLIRTREPELLDKIGLDAVAFLRFLRLMRWAFTGTTVLACGVLIPINWLYNEEFPPKRRDILSSMTIRDVKGTRLYAHVTVTYLITFLVLGLVYYHWKEMVRLRKQWFRSPEYMESFYARTISIMDVPKKYRSDEGIQEILETVRMPYPTTSVHIGRKVGQLPELIEYHNETVRELEVILVKYLKGGKVGRKRPTIRIGGFCCFGGRKEDAIEFYTRKLQRTEAAVEACRAKIDLRRAERYGFASLASVYAAHQVALKLRGKHPKGTTITLAPNPRDIIWENMNRTDGELFRRNIVGFFWLCVTCVFSLIALFPVATFANLDAITETGYLPFLQDWSRSSPISYSIISGVLPPALAALFTFFLPRVMRWLMQYMGAKTHSRLDRAVIARYFAFLVISQLIIFTLIGVAFNSVLELVELIGKRASAKDILDNLNQLPGTINKTYINQASFWLKWFPFRGFLVVFDLAQILNLLWISFKTHMFGRTPRDIREWTQPPVFEYAIYYSNLLLMAAVGFVFAPLAPLVALAAAIVFWLSSWLYKYQLMFVFVTRVETGGRLWNVVINRLLFCLAMMQVLMILTIGLQYKFRSLQWLSTVPPVIIIILFKIFIANRFDKEFDHFVPTPEELASIEAHTQRPEENLAIATDARRHRLQNRFGHPALHMDLFTPMLHARMMPLLAEVYKGKLSPEMTKSRVGENVGSGGPGRHMEAQVVDGIRIAYVEQSDLEYDPILYQRDRGERDWDRQTVSSAPMFAREGTASLWSTSNKDPMSATESHRGSSLCPGSGPTSPLRGHSLVGILTLNQSQCNVKPRIKDSTHMQILQPGSRKGKEITHKAISTEFTSIIPLRHSRINLQDLACAPTCPKKGNWTLEEN
ncbi:hypothetical protein AX16_003976 [Volvariella volvacea WC 439]|nr:hypothetical protein AX16_003976 [Volvariella volvacea WC 439]